MDSVYDRKTGKGALTTSKESMDDTFSKNMFGTEEVTVTVEYEGERNEQDDAELLEDEEQKIKSNDEEEMKSEEELNEEEEKVLENVKLGYGSEMMNRLTENEMRRIQEEAGRKRKHKKGKKHRKGRH